jgi:hypothetical protein
MKKDKTAGRIDQEKTRQEDGAGAGHPDNASAFDATEGRLLVMGRESAFSSEVIDYAIDMARRMSFEILALNSAPLSCDSFNLFSTSRSKLCQEFQSISEKNAIAFRHEAEANGIPFTHVVKFDEPDQALAGVQREYGNIEFVISEAQPAAAVDQVAESNRPRNEVLVYSMI